MIVHIIGSKSNIAEDIHYFREIRQILIAAGHSLGRDWIEEVYEETRKPLERPDDEWQKILDENIAALAKADVVIAEATPKTFSIGFQVATAIQQKKPVLILTRNKSLEGTLGSGISKDFVQFSDYTDKSLKDIILKFLEDNTIDTKDLRFNFFIDRPIYNYLRWAAYKTGKTKAEILRELVAKEIDKANEINQL